MDFFYGLYRTHFVKTINNKKEQKKYIKENININNKRNETFYISILIIVLILQLRGYNPKRVFQN